MQWRIDRDVASRVSCTGRQSSGSTRTIEAPYAAGYIGLLGSRRKQAVLTKALTAAGVPAESLARIRVPVGLAIGAETPEEIAVSVAAELVAWRRGGELLHQLQELRQRVRPQRSGDLDPERPDEPG